MTEAECFGNFMNTPATKCDSCSEQSKCYAEFKRRERIETARQLSFIPEPTYASCARGNCD